MSGRRNRKTCRENPDNFEPCKCVKFQASVAKKAEVIDTSTAKYRWWPFVRAMIRDYPSLKEELEDLHAQSITAGISSGAGGGGIKRTVEQIALRELPKDDQQAYDAVRKAIDITERKADGPQRMKLIRLVYWERNHIGLTNAAVLIHVSEITAKRWHGEFVRLVGLCYGFQVDTSEPK